MSFEGREVSICGKGHLIIAECIMRLDGPEECYCGDKIEWTRMIDDTNCAAFGDFPIGFFKVKTATVEEVCPTCKHAKLIEDVTYEIPTCTNCGSHNIVSGRYQPGYGGTPFVGEIKCMDCGTILM